MPALAERFDLIILDHPFCGDIASTGCLVPLDELAGPRRRRLCRAVAGELSLRWAHLGAPRRCGGAGRRLAAGPHAAARRGGAAHMGGRDPAREARRPQWDADRHRAEGRARPDDVLHTLRQSRRAMRRRGRGGRWSIAKSPRTHSTRCRNCSRSFPRLRWTGTASSFTRRWSRATTLSIARPSISTPPMRRRIFAVPCGSTIFPGCGDRRHPGRPSAAPGSAFRQSAGMSMPLLPTRLTSCGLRRSGIRTTPRAAGAERRMDGARHQCALRRRFPGDARDDGGKLDQTALSRLSRVSARRRESWSKAT